MNELIARAVAFRSKRLGVREIILIPKLAFWLLDSASIQRPAVDKRAVAAYALVSCPDGTF
jgi:hypothetical protein